MASEGDHLNLSCESSDFEENKTLSEKASKQYGPQPYLFELYTAENGSGKNILVHFKRHVVPEISFQSLNRVISSE